MWVRGKHGRREWFTAVRKKKKKAIKYSALSFIKVMIGMISYHLTRRKLKFHFLAFVAPLELG